MLDAKLIREEPDKIKAAIAAKNADPALVDEFLRLDEEWRKVTAELEALRARQNELSAKREIDAAKDNKEKMKAKESGIAELETRRESAWWKIPNLPSADTPVGKDESANQVLRRWGAPPAFDFEPKDHLALGEALGMINVEAAAKISGTRFGYILGDLARMEFALVQHALSILTAEDILTEIAGRVRPGYTAKKFVPVLPPVFIRPEVFRKMARLEPPEDKYHLPADDLYLIGSAEHTLGPLHMDEIIPAEKLPLRYVGFSTAFRRESGSYGKDTRGILRVHQFDKVEMESFVLPADGVTEQDFFVAIQEYLMQSLKLPYQVVICSTGDQGDPDARHLDIETWMPGQTHSTGSGRGLYRETHSADYMTDYQARRLNTRTKITGKNEFVHMNDATVFAIGRTLIAIMENYQTADGKIRVPEILQPYLGQEMVG